MEPEEGVERESALQEEGISSHRLRAAARRHAEEVIQGPLRSRSWPTELGCSQPSNCRAACKMC
eukprot:8005670-Pyramimonas_sp.AAC.2